MSATTTATAAPAPVEKAPRKVRAPKPKDNTVYLVTPSHFRNNVLRPIVAQTKKLIKLAQDVGEARRDNTDTTGKSTADLAKKQLEEFREQHVKHLVALAKYHREAFSLASNKGKRIIEGKGSKRANRPARTLAKYDTEFVDFLRDAADSHESLKFFKSFSMFDRVSPLANMSTQIMISQFLICYAAVHQRFNPSNRQFIQPNEMMLRYLGPGVKATLARQTAKIASLSAEYPGQIRFPFVQTLISYYRRPPTEEAEREALRTLSRDVSNVQTLIKENETLSRVRRDILVEYKKNLPERVKLSKPSKNVSLARKTRAVARAQAKTTAAVGA